jgi:predicted DNA-binding protein
MGIRKKRGRVILYFIWIGCKKREEVRCMSKKVYNIRLDENLVRVLDEVARKVGRTRSELVREGVVRLLMGEYKDLWNEVRKAEGIGQEKQ